MTDNEKIKRDMRLYGVAQSTGEGKHVPLTEWVDSDTIIVHQPKPVRRLLSALLLALGLASCSSLPGAQTLGLVEDPDSGKKALLVRMGLVVDALGVYGKLCAPVKTDACKSPQHYADAKLIAATIVDDAQLVVDGKLSPLAAGIIFGLTQAQLIKTLADEPAPTKPDAAPTQETIAYIDAIGAGLLLIQTADDRVAEGYGVNTTVAELMTDLQAKVAALP